MIIKKEKMSYKFSLAIFIVIFLTVIPLNRNNFSLIKSNTLHFLVSLDLGFSHTVALMDKGEGLFMNSGDEESISLYKSLLIPSLLKSIPKIIKYKFSSLSFQRVDIDIKHLDYQKILEDRDTALRKQLLSNPSKVKAKLRFGGEDFKADLRLKGDTKKHWDSSSRLSFRIELKGEKTILGLKKFSIQKPETRSHPYDFAFQSIIRQLGNLSTQHKYLKVFVNGENWGIMDVEEGMSKELLEKQRRKESAIVRFSNEKYWKYTYDSINPYYLYRLSSPELFVELYDSKKYLKDNRYRRVVSYISKRNANKFHDLFDFESLSKAYISAMAWGSFHTLSNNNAKYYFNPFTLKLEIITSDQTGYFHLKSKKEDIPFFNYVPSQFSTLLSSRFSSNDSLRELSFINKTLSNVDNHLNKTNQLFTVDAKKSGSLVIDNMKKILSEKNKYLSNHAASRYLIPRAGPIYKKDEDLLGRLEVDSSNFKLPTFEQASEFEEHIHYRHFEGGRIEIYNLLPDQVIVKDILYKGESLDKQEFVIPSYLSSPGPVTINTEYIGIEDGSFNIKTEYKGFIRELKNEISLTEDNILNPFLLRNSNTEIPLEKISHQNYELKKGNWVFNQPLVINGNLKILPGAKLKFSNNSYLLINGSLNAEGKPDKPIVFEAAQDRWKGIYVLNSKKRSKLVNVIVREIRNLEHGLLELTGAITFYKSNLDLIDVKINDVKAEDALNIVDSNFKIERVTINQANSDALDSDFSQGSISESKFFFIGGDALDFSGSMVEIDRVEAIKIGDKAVSIGEASIIKVSRSNFEDVNIGIATKDGSNALISQTTISNFKLHGVMSFIKKDFYGEPSVVLSECKIGPKNSFARQRGTKMTVDNIEIPETEIDIESIY